MSDISFQLSLFEIETTFSFFFDSSVYLFLIFFFSPSACDPLHPRRQQLRVGERESLRRIHPRRGREEHRRHAQLQTRDSR